MKCFLLIVIFAVSVVHAQTPLPLRILDAPLHIGDSVQKDMNRPQPDSFAIEAKFLWGYRGRVGELFLIIKISHLVPKDYPDFRNGFWQTSMILNDTDLGVLNKSLRGSEESSKIETLVIPFKASILKDGENVLKIKAGGKNGDLDDFEVHSIIIDSQKPR